MPPQFQGVPGSLRAAHDGAPAAFRDGIPGNAPALAGRDARPRVHHNVVNCIVYLMLNGPIRGPAVCHYYNSTASLLSRFLVETGNDNSKGREPAG